MPFIAPPPPVLAIEQTVTRDYSHLLSVIVATKAYGWPHWVTPLEKVDIRNAAWRQYIYSSGFGGDTSSSVTCRYPKGRITPARCLVKYPNHLFGVIGIISKDGRYSFRYAQ